MLKPQKEGVLSGSLRSVSVQNLWFAAALTTLFFGFGFIMIQHHEMWRDEMHAWTIARQSNSLAQLIFNGQYERYPFLWYLIVFFLTRFTSDPFAMQALHLVVAAAGIFLFARYAPFSRLQKTIFCFGYYPAFEFAIKARGYGLEMFLIFAFCSLYPRRYKNPLLLFSLICLLCQTNPTGFLLANCLGLTLLADLLQEKFFSTARSEVIAGAFLWGASIVTVLLQITPPPDYGFLITQAEPSIQKLFWVMGTISRAYLSFFVPTQPYFHPYSDGVSLLISLGLFFLSVLFFIRKPRVLFLYLSGTLLLLTFFFTTFLGYLWHHGHLFLWLILCFWLYEFYPERKGDGTGLEKASESAQKQKKLFLGIILLAQLIPASTIFNLDFHYAFSAAKETATFIKEQKMEEVLLVGDPDYAVSTVAMYLEKPIYYPKSRRFGFNMLWRHGQFGVLGPEASLIKAEEMMNLHRKNVLLILNYELDPKSVPPFAKEIKSFPRSIVPDEHYALYLFTYSGARVSKESTHVTQMIP